MVQTISALLCVDLAFFGLRASPTTSATTREDLRSKWPYVPTGVWMLSWPRWRWIPGSGTTAWINHEAFACHRSCGLVWSLDRQTRHISGGAAPNTQAIQARISAIADAAACPADRSRCP